MAPPSFGPECRQVFGVSDQPPPIIRRQHRPQFGKALQPVFKCANCAGICAACHAETRFLIGNRRLFDSCLGQFNTLKRLTLPDDVHQCSENLVSIVEVLPRKERKLHNDTQKERFTVLFVALSVRPSPDKNRRARLSSRYIWFRRVTDPIWRTGCQGIGRTGNRSYCQFISWKRSTK